jgi:hypothetical protein
VIDDGLNNEENNTQAMRSKPRTPCTRKSYGSMRSLTPHDVSHALAFEPG